MAEARSGSSTLKGWAGRAAFALSILGGILAILAAVGWSFAFPFGPLRVSLRHATNPALASILCGALSAWLLGSRRFGRLSGRLRDLLTRYAPVAAVVLSVAVAAVAWTHGAFVAGGADSAGYLSQATLWRSGSLPRPPIPVEGVTFVHGLHVLTPLGFRPDAAKVHLVPVYPPGLPLLMAGFDSLAGEGARFAVVPVTAGLLAWTTFVLGRRVAGPIVGLLASAASATSSTLLFQAVQPMSDVPAACFWVVAVALLLAPSNGAAVGAGLAAGVACLIRPNLFVLVPVLALGCWWWEPRRRGLVRAVLVCLLPMVAGLALAWWQRELYGTSTETGYGGITTLFHLRHVGPNLLNYPRWLWESHGVFILLALAAPWLLARAAEPPLGPHRDRVVAIAWWLMAMCATLFVFYVLYLPFDSWTYSRFLLPAIPLALVLASITAIVLIGWLPAWIGPLVLTWTLVLVPAVGASRARDLVAFQLWDSERRYVEVVDYLTAQPGPAVFLSMQHSGSLAYYAGQPIVRWDWLEPHEVEPLLAVMAASGRTVYAVLDDWEVDDVRRRFASTSTLAALPAPVFRSREREAIHALVFRVGGPPKATGK